VEFDQFLYGSWTDVPSLFLAMNKVTSMIQNEAQRAKNKVVKSQGAKKYLTLKIVIKKVYFQT
jgi:hypothetical protein